MNSQCNGSFAQNQRADAGGNRRVLIESLLSVSVFLTKPPYRPKTPTLAHVGRTDLRWTVFTPPGTAATWAHPTPSSPKPNI
jgi:hypothetical protein